jgi:YecR-like lipoprotein
VAEETRQPGAVALTAAFLGGSGMRFRRAVTACLAVAVATCILGCARNKELVATGGSRSDGTVVMSYEFGPGEIPKVNTEQGTITARERCKAWGYTDAQPFGGETKQCNSPGSYGCGRWFVSMTYQCLGGNHPS